MPGFLGGISKSGVLKNFDENKKKNLIDEKYIVITKGVILNSLKLIIK